MCTRCNEPRPIEFVRSWRAGHFFFVPLFSYDHVVLSRCRACGREGVGYFPRPLPPLPFMDRLGWLLPVGAIGAVIVLFMVTIATTPATTRATAAAPVSKESAKAGEALRDRLERNLLAGKNDTAEEAEIATAVAGRIASSYENVGRTRVAVRLQTTSDGDAAAHKRAIVLVEIGSLRHAGDEERRRLLEDVRDALAHVLAPDDEAIVGIKGTLLYGAMAVGPVGVPWARTKIAPSLREELDAALAEASEADSGKDAR